MLEELLKSDGFEIEGIYHTKDWTTPPFGKGCTEIDRKTLGRISSQKHPNQVLATVKIPSNDGDLELGSIVLLLDTVQDPGNLGTILRTAAWFGIKSVILGEGTADPYNPKVIQSSMGAIFRLNIYSRHLLEVIPEIKQDGFKVFSAVLGGENIYDMRKEEKVAVVLGNESKGVSEAVQSAADGGITIPSYGDTESLNVSTAAAIICAELRRSIVS